MEEMIAHRSGMKTMAELLFLSELFLYKFLSRRERDEENRKEWGMEVYPVPVGTAASMEGLSQVLTCSQAKPLVPNATL